MDAAAILELLCLFLEVGEVIREMVLNRPLGLLVAVGVVNDDAEARCCVRDQAVDVLLQVGVQVDRLDVLHSRLHVEQELVNGGLEVALVWGEAHAVSVELDLGGDGILLRAVLHLAEDEVSRLLVDAHLSLDNTVVDEADEGAQALVVVACKVENLVLEVALLFLEHDRLLLLGFTFLGVLEVFFFAEGAAVTDLLREGDQAVLDLLVDLGAVVALGVVVMVTLRVHEHLQLEGLGLLFDVEGQFALHFVDGLVDAHKLLQEVGTRKDEVLGEVLAGTVVHAVAHVTLPKAENLTDQVVLEELHAGEHVEHSGLLHPLGQGKELSWNVGLLLTLNVCALVLENLHDTLSTDREVLGVELFGVLRWCDHEVVRPKFSEADFFAVAVEELDRHVGAVLREEGNSLLTSLD